MKKIVIFGGGSGLSQILKGLKLFPVEVTAVVSVADNGHSTGALRADFNIPAVGDITKVMLAMSDAQKELIELLNYRFSGDSVIGNHSIKNLLLTALLNTQGDLNKSIPIMCDILKIKGTILPITSDCVELVGVTESGKEIVGEEDITKSKEKIKTIKYDKEAKVNEQVIEAIKEADLIILSSGSVFTSIVPNLLFKEVREAIDKTDVPLLYLCNLVTQPGETDGFSVSDHLNFLNDYLGEKKITGVLANNKKIDPVLAEKYATQEQKDPVVLDIENLTKMKVRIISDSIYTVENEILRHDSLKTAYLIFSYLMRNKK